MHSRLVPLAFLLIAAAALAAQGTQSSSSPIVDDSQQPTFVAGTQYVRVDVYVTRDGQLVEDLRPEEVSLFEDEVPQAIDTFERIVFRAADRFVRPVEARTLDTSLALVADSRSRVFVVFIDPWHASFVNDTATQRRFPVLGTLDSVLGPDDLVAVMTPEMRPDDLTFVRGLQDLATLEGEWLRLGPESIINREPLRELDDVEIVCGGHPIRHEKRVLDALESLAAYLGDLREERKAVLIVSDGWRIYFPSKRAGEGGGEPPRLPDPPIGTRGRGRGRGDPIVVTQRGAREVTGADETRCRAERAALELADHRGRLQEIVNTANRNNVSFYPMSPAGLTTDVSPPRAAVQDTIEAPYENRTPLAVQSTLRVLAEQTDGYAVVNTNNLRGGVERMMADSSAYYLIGYASTNTTLDGRFRRISVRVSRPGVEVRARPGYVATPPEPDATPSLDRSLDPIALAVGRLAETSQSPSPLRLAGSVWSGPGTTGAHEGGFLIAGELDAAVRREPAWASGATAEIAVLAPGGGEILTTSTELTGSHPGFVVRIPEAGSVVPGEYLVRIRMQGADALAHVNETVRVIVPSVAAPMGDAILWRRGPSTGPEATPTVDPRFRRNERLRLELPVASGDPVNAYLLDRTGGRLAVPLEVTDRREGSDAIRWVVIDVPLSPLAQGDYVVEVKLGGTTRLTAFAIVP